MSSGRGSRLTVTVFTDWLNAVMNILVFAYQPSYSLFVLGFEVDQRERDERAERSVTISVRASFGSTRLRRIALMRLS